MTKVRQRTGALLIAVAAGAWVADAAAQFGGAGGGFGGGLGGSRIGRGNRSGDATGATRDGRNERPVAAPDPASIEQLDYRLALLQDELKLTDMQYPAWQAFAGKVRAYGLDIARERNRSLSAAAVGAPQSNGLQSIGQAVDAARNRLTALEEVETAAKSMYGTLTPEQKALADGRLAAVVTPRQSGAPVVGPGANLPDLGSGDRSRR